jgi:myo-inositol-1-phosphate synthase
MAPNIPSTGYNTPESQLESILPIHPTAARRPDDSVVVQSENTLYTDQHITSTFFNRGADVTVTNGTYTVTPTVKPYQFQTTRKVGKTGFVWNGSLSVSISTDFRNQAYDGRRRREQRQYALRYHSC